MIKNFKWVVLVSLTFIACTNDDTTTTGETPVTAGTADFSRYVALGDSFAAGFSDGALFKKGQENSYPNLLAQQFAAAGGGVFSSPYMAADNVGGFSAGGTQVASQRLYLELSSGNPTPTLVPGVSANTLTERLTGSFNNMGIPGAKSFHLLFNGYAPLNPYFKRMASATTATVLGDALAQNPTFFSLWIGGNDELGYATNGGVPTSQDAVNGNDLTPTASFTAAYNTLAAQLSANGRKGVVANLPYVTALPYFTAVPYSPLTASVLGSGNAATGLATINALNTQLYGPLKAALNAVGGSGRIDLLSTTVANPLLIKDETLTNLSVQLTAAFTPSLGATVAAIYGAIFGQARQTTATDLVLLPTQGAIGAAPTASDSGIGVAPTAPLNKFGITFPLQDKHVLVPTEIAEIKAATDAYNLVIQAAAIANNLAFVDAKSVMNQLSTTGLNFNTYTMTSTYVTGGSFSLDGVHPGARGYALIANLFIDAINAKYGSTLKKKDGRDYQILYPKVIN